MVRWKLLLCEIHSYFLSVRPGRIGSFPFLFLGPWTVPSISDAERVRSLIIYQCIAMNEVSPLWMLMLKSALLSN